MATRHSGEPRGWLGTSALQVSSRSHPVVLAAQPPKSTPGQGLAGSMGSCSPPAMLAPSFCQVTSGRGTPLASQDSTVLALTFTITMPGRGFKAGGSARDRNAATSISPATCREQDPLSHTYRAPRAGGVFGQCLRRSSPCRCSDRCAQAAPA